MRRRRPLHGAPSDVRALAIPSPFVRPSVRGEETNDENMNSPQAKLRRVRAEEEARAGPSLKKLKTDLLKKVITKTIVKEQHAESVRKL